MPLDTLNPATLMSGRFRPSDIPSLAGRTAVVTGGTAGIGYYTALPLAQAGAHVVIIGTTPEHGTDAEQEISAAATKAGKGGSIQFVQCDFGDLKQVNSTAKKLAGELDRLDILVNNAGVGQAPFALTKDGLENHFQVNNLSHYVLTLRLLPLMQKTAKSAPPASVRICMQSSEMHRLAPSDCKFATKDEINEPRDGAIGYGRSKLGLILLARMLVRHKVPTNDIIITSVHPGTVDTDLQNAWTEMYGMLGTVAEKITRAVGKSAPEGAEAGLWAVTSTEITQSNAGEFQGNYYSEAHGKPQTETDQAKDEELGERFWVLCRQLSADILGEQVD